ncbi:hypothetical protein [Streptomyces sp. NBC_01358]|uniref:hypothetical protein n=1 Tax=Streptomyces sp. NBC_01358 TaxID=2903837 RepID=UPI002E317856|nr:hypothetical protein [Streptomyces sp. NBC_01358]
MSRQDGEGVTPRAALDLFLGDPGQPARPRKPAVGAVADLCLLHVPLGEALDALSADVVRAAYVGGKAITP